jgi:hypothetical protein
MGKYNLILDTIEEYNTEEKYKELIILDYYDKCETRFTYEDTLYEFKGKIHFKYCGDGSSYKSEKPILYVNHELFELLDKNCKDYSDLCQMISKVLLKRNQNYKIGGYFF